MVDVVICCGFDIGMSDTVLWEWGLQWISVISGLYKVVVVLDEGREELENLDSKLSSDHAQY